ILSHYGKAEDAIFEVKWKSSDVTWLPYSQIQGLQALGAYLELQGADNISQLKKGSGKPPFNDP
ncbi:hypothetical protein CPC08DRAFT_614316, partial [Agrocybe pediades]